MQSQQKVSFEQQHILKVGVDEIQVCWEPTRKIPWRGAAQRTAPVRGFPSPASHSRLWDEGIFPTWLCPFPREGRINRSKQMLLTSLAESLPFLRVAGGEGKEEPLAAPCNSLLSPKNPEGEKPLSCELTLTPLRRESPPGLAIQLESNHVALFIYYPFFF